MPRDMRREKDPVKVAAGKKGGRPVSVNGLERLTVRVSPEWNARLRQAADEAKAAGRDVPMAKIARFAIELLLKELDAKDLLTLFLEDPDKIELEIRERTERGQGVAVATAAGRRRGRTPRAEVPAPG